MTKWTKVLLAIMIFDITMTSIGAKFLGAEYLPRFEFNPLMLRLMSYSILLFASVKLLTGCICIKIISLASYSEKIYKYVAIAYAVILLASITVDLTYSYLPK